MPDALGDPAGIGTVASSSPTVPGPFGLQGQDGERAQVGMPSASACCSSPTAPSGPVEGDGSEGGRTDVTGIQNGPRSRIGAGRRNAGHRRRGKGSQGRVRRPPHRAPRVRQVLPEGERLSQRSTESHARTPGTPSERAEPPHLHRRHLARNLRAGGPEGAHRPPREQQDRVRRSSSAVLVSTGKAERDRNIAAVTVGFLVADETPTRTDSGTWPG